MKILRDYGDINHPLIAIVSIMQTLGLSVMAVASFHALGLAFDTVSFIASGPLAIHMGVMSLVFWYSKKLLSAPYEMPSIATAVGSGFLNTALYGVMAVNAILVGVYIFDFDVNRLWIVSLLAPALLAWRVQEQLDAHGAARDEHLTAENDDELSDAEVYSEITRKSPMQALRGGLGDLKWQLIVIICTVLVIVIGFIYYYYLSAAFLDGDVWSFNRINRVISASVEGMLPTIIGLVVAVTLIFGSISLWNAFSKWRLKQQQDDIDRQLTDYEVGLIEHCTQVLEDYVANRQYPSIVKYVYWLVVLGWFAVMAGSIFLMIIGDGLGASLFKPDRVEGLGWFIYVDGIGVAEVLIVFILIVGYFALFSHLFRNWTDLTEHNLLKAKTEHYDSDELLGKLREDLAMDVRKYIITSKASFDPAAYLKSRAKSYGKWMNITTGALLFITICFWVLDRRDYELITEDYVQYTDYWTGEQTQIPLSSIRGIRITCKANEKDNLDIGYGLVVDDDTKINIVTNGREANERLDNLEYLDEILDRLGIEKIAASNKKFPNLFDAEECADQLSNRDSPIRNRLLNVFKPDSHGEI